MKLITTLKLSALSLLTAAACGGGSGVTDKPLNELTDDEWIETCEASQDDVSADATTGIAHYYCAAFSCQDQATFDDCLAQNTDPDECDAPDADDALRDCELPASTFTACLAAYSNQFEAYVDTDCDNIDEAEAPAEFADIPECDEVLAECPDVFG
jgi:hypothetical protein